MLVCRAAVQSELGTLEICADRNLMKFNQSMCKFLHLGCKFSIKHCRMGVGLASEQLCSKGLGWGLGGGGGHGGHKLNIRQKLVLVVKKANAYCAVLAARL